MYLYFPFNMKKQQYDILAYYMYFKKDHNVMNGIIMLQYWIQIYNINDNNCVVDTVFSQ